MRSLGKKLCYLLISLLVLWLAYLVASVTPNYDRFYIKDFENSIIRQTSLDYVNSSLDADIAENIIEPNFYILTNLAKNNGHYVFINKSSWFYFKLNGSKIEQQARLAIEQKQLVEIKYYGFFLPRINHYPNILAIKSVASDDPKPWRVLFYSSLFILLGFWIFLISTIGAIFSPPRNHNLL